MKKTLKETCGTSFYGSTIKASLTQLKTIFGEPPYHGDPEDKVQWSWDMETESGGVFTIYDWKEYRYFIDTEVIEWHIGGFNKFHTIEAQTELQNALLKL